MNVTCLTALLLFMTLASCQVLKVSTYTDASCTTPNGGYFAVNTGTLCTNQYSLCTPTAGLYVKGECTADPIDTINPSPNVAYILLFTSTDGSCVVNYPASYVYAFVGPLDTCFAGLTGVRKYSGCNGNGNITMLQYSSYSSCLSNATPSSKTESINGTCSSSTVDYQLYCPTPIAAPLVEPVATPAEGPIAEPLNNDPIAAPSVEAPLAAPSAAESPIDAPMKAPEAEPVSEPVCAPVAKVDVGSEPTTAPVDPPRMIRRSCAAIKSAIGLLCLVVVAALV